MSDGDNLTEDGSEDEVELLGCGVERPGRVPGLAPAGVGEVNIHPAAEEVVLVPLGLTVPDQGQGQRSWTRYVAVGHLGED